ncbi:MAG: hypothetical protein EXS10_04975 [Phycisphaerales bacterium]|nr:hypothetical protein [Phycisphaerales bacterium]
MLRASHGLILAVLTLLVIGIVMVNSAGLVVAPDPALLQSGQVTDAQFQRMLANYRPISFEQLFFGRTTILAFLSLAALAIAAFVPVDRILTARGLRSPIPWLFGAILLTLVLVHVPGIGREVNHSARWIGSPTYGFQASELAKWGMVCIISWYCIRHGATLKSFYRGFLPALAIVGVVAAAIAVEDLGTGALVFAACLMLLIVGGMRWAHILLLVPVGLVGAVFAIFTSPYRVNRLLAWNNPWADPEGIGYHIIQSMSAIAGGGMQGLGLGNSVQKFGYLPEDTTDFIFAIVCEELGVFGALMVLATYAALLLSGLAIVTRGASRPDADTIVSPFSRLVGTGILFVIGLQALINVLVVTGLAPTKGIALPLLSSGGSGWVMTCFSLGLLISIERSARAKERALGIDLDESTPSASTPVTCTATHA